MPALTTRLPYGCDSAGDQPPVLSDEHPEIGFFSLAEVAGLTMPAGYRRSIGSWFARLAAGA